MLEKTIVGGRLRWIVAGVYYARLRDAIEAVEGTK